jgi:hypothetical protein
LGGPQIQSGCCGEEKNLALLGMEIEPSTSLENTAINFQDSEECSACDLLDCDAVVFDVHTNVSEHNSCSLFPLVWTWILHPFHGSE